MIKNVKAAVMARPRQMEVRSFPYPELKKGCAIVKIEMCGICGTDKHNFVGESKMYAGTPQEKDVPFPIIPGHENVGIIEDIDEEAKTSLEYYGRPLKAGDRVVINPDVICGKCRHCREQNYTWCENMTFSYGDSITADTPPHLFGGFSEYMFIVPGTMLIKVPDDATVEMACLSELMCVAYNVDKLRQFYSMDGEGLGPESNIAIQGIGPLGLMHMLRARMQTMGKIIVIDRSEYRLEMAKKFGADFTFNTMTSTEKERYEFVQSVTDGYGLDIVIEAAGTPKVVNEGLKMLKKGGYYLDPGNFVDMGDIPFNINRVVTKNLRIIGSSNLVHSAYGPSLRMMADTADRIPWNDIITHKYPLEKAQEAMLKAMAEDSMKVAITPNVK